ncbi:hypothetical protein NA57DRAFT_73149 [Rhizodiscina lignyota]|uniref:Uncharacterized protein n=1 Tax=Rhizodiscina lignyota TaxID=1504668 RepID=A0A9P4MBS3_9PEZI|nr:hypothetical protein NA57DRAFT_73149 [Rhizodiscina lignyota]
MSSNLFFQPSCPSGGQWYVCDSDTSKFVGCCATDPCHSKNGCPAGNLKPASFDAQYEGQFHDQQCSAGRFWTCATTDPPFLGCCESNPCQPDNCPSGNLTAAFLSNDPDAAADFLGSTAQSSRSGLSPGAIAGIAVGGLVGLILIAVIAWLWRRTSRFNQKCNSNIPEASKTNDTHITTVNMAEKRVGVSDAEWTAGAYGSPAPPYYSPEQQQQQVQSLPYSCQSYLPDHMYWGGNHGPQSRNESPARGLEIQIQPQELDSVRPLLEMHGDDVISAKIRHSRAPDNP